MKSIAKIKRALKRKDVVALFASCLAMAYSAGAHAFTCKDAGGTTIGWGGGTANVHVNLNPSVQPGQVLVVDLSRSISCKNDSPNTRNDEVSLLRGSAYNDLLATFNGTVNYYGSSYPFPTTSETKKVNNTSGSFIPWQTQLYLSPISAAGGVAIKPGDVIAKLVMQQKGSNTSGGGGIEYAQFTWNIIADNTVVVPTGGCDVSSRNVTITLPDYPGTAPVSLTAHCAQNQQLSYYLTGPTTDTASTIFANTSSSNPASGVGIQLSNGSGVIATNSNVAMGTVGTNNVSLGLTASYARRGGRWWPGMFSLLSG